MATGVQGSPQLAWQPAHLALAGRLQVGGAREWGVGPLQDPSRGVAAAMVGGLFGVGEEATGC